MKDRTLEAINNVEEEDKLNLSLDYLIMLIIDIEKASRRILYYMVFPLTLELELDPMNYMFGQMMEVVKVMDRAICDTQEEIFEAVIDTLTEFEAKQVDRFIKAVQETMAVIQNMERDRKISNMYFIYFEAKREQVGPLHGCSRV